MWRFFIFAAAATSAARLLSSWRWNISVLGSLANSSDVIQEPSKLCSDDAAASESAAETKLKNAIIANAVVFATELPTGIAVQDITVNSKNLVQGENTIEMVVNPANTTEEITVAVDETNSSHVTAEILDINHVKITCGSSTTSPVTTIPADTFCV